MVRRRELKVLPGPLGHEGEASPAIKASREVVEQRGAAVLRGARGSDPVVLDPSSRLGAIWPKGRDQGRVWRSGLPERRLRPEWVKASDCIVNGLRPIDVNVIDHPTLTGRACGPL